MKIEIILQTDGLDYTITVNRTDANPLIMSGIFQQVHDADTVGTLLQTKIVAIMNELVGAERPALDHEVTLSFRRQLAVAAMNNLHNPNCDGGLCLISAGEVRVLPLDRDSNLHLCHCCYQFEMAHRRERNKELASDSRFNLPAWETLKIAYEANGKIA
jgi:hypothetical protein